MCCASTPRSSSMPPRASTATPCTAPSMTADEGLVGLVAEQAEPLNLSDAQAHPAFSLPPGDRRRNLSLLPRRADPARRQYARRAGGAESRPAHLFGGRSRGAADHRDGAGRDDRLRRIVGRSPSPAPSRPRGIRCTERRAVCRRHCARPCRAARAARGRHQLHRRRPAEGTQAARRRDGQACAPISTECSSAATSPTAASTATCSKPTACSPMTAAGCTSCARR